MNRRDRRSACDARRGWSALAPALLFASAAILPAACSTDSSPSAPPGAGTAQRPEAISAEGGAEVVSVLAEDPRAVAKALSEWAGADGRPAPVSIEIDSRLRAVLEACGVRLVAMPLDRAAAAASAAMEGTRGSSKASQFVPAGPNWVEVTREGGDAEPRVVALHDSRVRLRPGYLRLIMRCWSEPVAAPASAGSEPGAGAAAEAGGTRFSTALHMELAFQHVETDGGTDPWMRNMVGSRATRTRALDDQGQVFSRLSTSIRLRANQAVAVVYAPPGATWSDLETQEASIDNKDALGTDEPAPPPRPAARLGEVRGEPDESQPEAPSAPATAGPGAGVAMFRSPTLGEVLLCAGHAPLPVLGGELDARLAARPAGRVVLFILPRIRDDYSLLGE